MTQAWPAAGIGVALVRISEATVIAAEAHVGRGDEQAADLAAAREMKRQLSELPVRGRIVVGDPDVFDGDEAVLPNGAAFGSGEGPEIDLAVDPIEGVTIAAKAKANAIATMAIAPRGGFRAVPPIYMDKLAIGPGHDPDILDLDAPVGDVAERLARSKGVPVSEITACVLDRPRHEKIIADLRRVGARVNLIGDGDVAAVIQTALGTSPVDLYAGHGGAAEGVLGAAALNSVGGAMQTRLVLRSREDERLAAEFGFDSPRECLGVRDLVPGPSVFVATGITRGNLLDGVERTPGGYQTHTLVMSSHDGVVRWVRSSIPRSAVESGRNG